ncbi:hypothetical protein LSH36_204g05024 [Paralvinella palmiformis]|uniref:SOCS box domain-containing protein n=1 Tax=Paralvinella palmiformis TaxID=53620 RepID=A0AAD9JRH3_9ANNE|nr:hypothetical protein LSH36_204g05024 [Paralvinella palmiformis]
MGGCGSTSAIKIPHEKRYRRAIKLYQVTEVKSLTNLLNRNKCFESGESPLTLAAQEGHEAVVQSLVASGADVNKLDNNGRGPLHIAVQLNDDETAEILLAANANPNKYDSGNVTPLHLAAENGNVNLVRRLIKAGANVNESQRGLPPLVHAIAHGHAECAEMLLRHGADPNVLDARGNTVLHVAVRQKDTLCTRLLLEYKASPRLPSHDNTPLVCLASLTGGHETLKLLLDMAGCDVGVGSGTTDDEELPSIIAATVVGNADCIDVLLAAGADPNSIDRRGCCALQIAVTSVVDVNKESFYSKYFTNLYRQYSRYDVGELSHENSTRCAMSLVTGGADSDRVWDQFALLFPSPDGMSFEQMVLCEVLIQCYGFRSISPQALSSFVEKLVAVREYGLLKLLYSAGVDPTWNDESRVGMSAEDADREMYRWIKKLRTNARSLKDLCRRRIRHLLSWNVLYLVHRLPLISEDLKEYVCIMDTDHYSVNPDDLQQQNTNQETTSGKRPSQNDVTVTPQLDLGNESPSVEDQTLPEQSVVEDISANSYDQTPNCDPVDVNGRVERDIGEEECLVNGGASPPTIVGIKETGNTTNGEVRNLLEGRTSIKELTVDDTHRLMAT